MGRVTSSFTLNYYTSLPRISMLLSTATLVNKKVTLKKNKIADWKACGRHVAGKVAL